MRRRFGRSRSAGSVPIALTALTMMLVGSIPAVAALHPGDVVMVVHDLLTSPSPPAAVAQIDPATGASTSLAAGAPLVDARDVVVRPDGTVLVADAASGLLAVNPVTGTISVVADAAAFGGTGPTAVALAPNGDVVAAGPWGVKRLAGGAGPPLAVSGPGLMVDPRGVTVDGTGTIWVSDAAGGPAPGSSDQYGGIARVDPATGIQAWLTLSCPTSIFPRGPGSIRLAADGFLYVVSGSGYGPADYNNGGLYRVNAASGAADLWKHLPFTFGFDLDTAGSALILSAETVSHGAYGTLLERYDGSSFAVIGNCGSLRGPMALVPAGVTPARRTSWGALKTLYR